MEVLNPKNKQWKPRTAFPPRITTAETGSVQVKGFTITWFKLGEYYTGRLFDPAGRDTDITATSKHQPIIIAMLTRAIPFN